MSCTWRTLALQTVLLIALGAPRPAAASLFEFEIQRGAKPISTLNWETLKLEVEVEEEAPNVFRFSAKVPGTFSETDGSLLWNYQQVAVKPATRKFELPVDIRGPSTPLKLVAVDPMGTIQEEEVLLVSKSWAEMLQFLATGGPVGRRYTAGLSIASLSYSEPLVPSFSQVALAGKVGVVMPFSNGLWYLDGNLYGTLQPLSSSIAGTSLRAIGLNVRGGRRVYEFNDQLSLWGQGGWFYTTTISSGREFGFKNLLAPQANPVLTYRINARTQVAAYFKFAPLFGLNFSERELAFGGGWSSRTLKGFNYGFGFDFSDLQIQVEGEPLRSTNIVLGGSFSF